MEAINILEYEPGLQPAFEKLNRDWISKYFTMEPVDEEVVTNPEAHIMKDGGAILFASFKGQVVGTVALKKEGNELFELCKMAVDENFRGHHAGLILGEAALQKAKSLGAKQVILYSETTFNNGIAINLYHRLGFKEVELEKGGYERCNIKMVYDFAVHDYLQSLAEKLRSIVKEYWQHFAMMSTGEWNKKISVKKWSNKEILGHLIDSAANNHQRFVRAHLSDPLEFPGYMQEEWVSIQNYQHHETRELIDLWFAYNQTLASVIGNIHPQRLGALCHIGDNPPVTLQFLLEDYIDHLLRHLNQITANTKQHAKSQLISEYTTE